MVSKDNIQIFIESMRKMMLESGSDDIKQTMTYKDKIDPTNEIIISITLRKKETSSE